MQNLGVRVKRPTPQAWLALRIEVGHYAAVQAVDYNGDGLTDVLTGNQERQQVVTSRVDL